MKAIILVAGMGTRLKPLTDKIHKCLTEVNGKAILVNMLENLENTGIEETILVVGYLGNQIKGRIGNKFGNMKISYVENPIFDKTNNSYSLWLALENLLIDDKVLILEGDVFFENELLKRFLKDDFSISITVQKYQPNLDGSFVELDKNNIVLDWVHKKVRPVDFTLEDKFKTVNIHKFDKVFTEGILKPTLRRHAEENQGTSPIEYIMQDIVRNRNREIHAFEVGDLKWFEIDDINDLKIAREIFKK